MMYTIWIVQKWSIGWSIGWCVEVTVVLMCVMLNLSELHLPANLHRKFSEL